MKSKERMASAFWTLEDGRVMACRWTGMAYMLELITIELKEIEGAQEFYVYLDQFVYREENGDFPNGFGGFIRNDESVLINIDLRTFARMNREFFWLAAQNALTKIRVSAKKESEAVEFWLLELLDIHKRIERGEDPMQLNDMTIIAPVPTEKLGPGW